MAELREAWEILRQTYREWRSDAAMRLAAAVSFYAIFSIAPMLLVLLEIAGWILGAEKATGTIDRFLHLLLEPQTATALASLVERAHFTHQGLGTALVTTVILVTGASGIFRHLKTALNTIWDAPRKNNRGWWTVLESRIVSVVMVIATIFFLAFSITVTSILSSIAHRIEIPEAVAAWRLLTIIVFFVLLTVVFALVYRFVPDARASWRHIWFGAAMTSAIFSAGQLLLGFYFTRSSLVSSYGAAGSLVVVLIWVYFATLTLFFGACFTEVLSRHGQKRE